jgi:threonine synthase
MAEVEQLKALYPEFKEMPDEVAKSVANGANLLTAYIAYREKQNSKAAASLKKENEVLKQNAASAAKAPVRGVTGGGATNTKPRNDLLKGFDDDAW